MQCIPDCMCLECEAGKVARYLNGVTIDGTQTCQVDMQGMYNINSGLVNDADSFTRGSSSIWRATYDAYLIGQTNNMGTNAHIAISYTSSNDKRFPLFNWKIICNGAERHSYATYTRVVRSDCIDCEAGKYRTDLNSASCVPCQANSDSTAGAPFCRCVIGYTGLAGLCSQCLAGTYKDEVGSAECDNCPSFSDSAIGSTAITTCVCNTGYSGGNGQTCVVCDINNNACACNARYIIGDTQTCIA